MTRRWLTILTVTLVLSVGGTLVWYYATWPTRQTAAAQRALSGGEYMRAESLLLPLLKSRPQDSTGHHLHAQALRHQKRYDEAENALDRAMKNGLDRAIGLREAALLLASRDWPAQADGFLQQTVRNHPDDIEVLQTLAEGYARRGRWKESIPLYSALVKLAPDEVEYLYQRGLANMNDTFFNEAIDDFRRVLA